MALPDRREPPDEDEEDFVLTQADFPNDDPLLPPICILSPEEWDEKIDRVARLYMHMSGEEFKRKWYGGEFDDDPDHPEIMAVAMLLPLAR